MFIDSRDLRLLAVQGLSMSEIARELEVPFIRVRRAAIQYSIDIPPGLPISQVPRVVRTKPVRIKPPEAPDLRIGRIKELAAAGKTRREIASELGVGVSTLFKLAQSAGIEITRANAAAKDERAEKMANMYRQGITLAGIGATFGVTRERVRQILKRIGIAAKEGGGQKRSAVRRQQRETSREARSLAKWGMSCDEVQSLRRSGVLHAFKQQKRNAEARGITWDLSLAQWWDVWQTSGKWEQRGRGKGAYVMSRIQDAGGYEFGNVHVQLAEENSREAVKKWAGKAKANRGVFLLYPGRRCPWMAKVGQHKLGFFPTEEEAVAARIKYADENGLELSSDGRLIGRRSRLVHACSLQDQYV